MDLHRCRFVDHPSSAINTLAFSHRGACNASIETTLKLAVGRANGNIEIWNPCQGLWCQERVFYGGKNRSVEGLAWTCDPESASDAGKVVPGRLRLFSIGYSSTVTEWDLATGLPLRQSSGSNSEIWCLAAQPCSQRRKKSKHDEKTRAGKLEDLSKDIAIGCADGSVVLLSTADDSLNLKGYIARTSERKARALSMAWYGRRVLAVGFADTSIRIYDASNSHLIRAVSLGGGPRGGPKEKLVWAVEFLKDGTLVSGDSAGEICFWDQASYAPLQRIQSHDSDILCLTSSAMGDTVFSSGMDQRTCSYSKGPNSRWSKTSNGRIHKHDVKAMTSFENQSMSVIVSGGLDTRPIVAPLREFGREVHRRLPHLPQTSPVISAQRLVVSWWETQVSIWRVHPRSQILMNQSNDGAENPANNYQLLSRATMKSEEHITCVSITPDGSLLVVATVAEIKIFRLKLCGSENARLKIKKLDLQRSIKGGAYMVQFSPDSKWLLSITCKNEIYMERLIISDSGQRTIMDLQSQRLRRIRRPAASPNSLNNGRGSYDRTIVRAAISDDSHIVAVADIAGYIDTWLLTSEDGEDPVVKGVGEDSIMSEDSSGDDDSSISESIRKFRKPGQRWRCNPSAPSLPRLPDPPLLLSFQALPKPVPKSTDPETDPTSSTNCTGAPKSQGKPSTAGILLSLSSTHTLTVHDIYTSAQTPWSLRNPTAVLPAQFKIQLDRAVGCVWDVQQARQDVLYPALQQENSLPSPESDDAANSTMPEDDKARPERRGQLQRRRQNRQSTSQQSSQPNHLTRCRIWIYGANWLCMLDLLQDLPLPISLSSETQQKTSKPSTALVTPVSNTHNLKRKRSPVRDKYQLGLAEAKHTSGAGGTRKSDELGHGLRLTKSNRGAAPRDPDNADDPDSTAIRLAITRRQEHAAAAGAASSALSTSKKSKKQLTKQIHESSPPTQPPSFFLTNEYRSILGVVPLASPESSTRDDATPAALEVALIERNVFDLDLGPRFEKAWEGGRPRR